MKRQPNTPPLQFPCLPAPVPPTCSSTADCQQRVRFLMMLLGKPWVARELQSWLLFLPSMETKAEAKWGQPLSSWVPIQG